MLDNTNQKTQSLEVTLSKVTGVPVIESYLFDGDWIAGEGLSFRQLCILPF